MNGHGTANGVTDSAIKEITTDAINGIANNVSDNAVKAILGNTSDGVAHDSGNNVANGNGVVEDGTARANDNNLTVASKPYSISSDVSVPLTSDFAEDRSEHGSDEADEAN